MDLYDSIYRRKSTRQYNMTPLSKKELDEIARFAGTLKPLYPDIQTAFEIAADARRTLSVKAPHYLVIMSESKEGYRENIGFMFQQLDLYLSHRGLGSCWLGMAKPVALPQAGLPVVIMLAFGKAEGDPYRDPSELKRKPLAEISDGSDRRLEAARVAPSAVNKQNWFFSARGGEIDVFQKKDAVWLLDKLGRIDIGIALCHLYVATEHEGKAFVFTTETGKEKKGHVYIGTVK